MPKYTISVHIPSQARDQIIGVFQYANSQVNWDVIVPGISNFGSAHETPDREINGLICMAFGDEELKRYLARGIPLVSCSARTFGMGVPRASVDNRAIGRMAAAHFLDRGFRNFGYYSHGTISFAVERGEGFAQAIEEQGGTYRQFSLPWDHNQRKARQHELLAWLRGLLKPAAVLATDDYYAADLLTLCRVNGISVPEEVAILGVNNDELTCLTSSPALSSIDCGFARVGYAAAKLLSQIMEGENSSLEPVLIPPVNVVIRQSTDVIAISDPVVSQAAALMREQFAAPLTVDYVCRQVGVSRRVLEKRFQAATGRSPKQELMTLRLARASELLATTDLPLDLVADRSGLVNGRRLCSLFAKRQNQTPNAYRQSVRLRSG